MHLFGAFTGNCCHHAPQVQQVLTPWQGNQSGLGSGTEVYKMYGLKVAQQLFSGILYFRFGLAGRRSEGGMQSSSTAEGQSGHEDDAWTYSM